MRKHWPIAVTVLVLSVVVVFLTGCFTAPLQNRISYQGRLTDAGGTPINGTRNMTFRLFMAASGGSALWQETQTNVPVTDGLFNVTLGMVTPLDEADFHMPQWLEVTVDTETLPRQPLYGSPYAFSLVPGAVIKGSITSSETYSSTLTIANFASGQGLAVISTGGPAIAAQGTSALLADGAIQSTAKTYLWISGNSLVKNLSTDLTRWDMTSAGAAQVWSGAAAGGSRTIYYPVTIPSVLYGTPARVTQLTVYYKCQNATQGYINGTSLYKQVDADSTATIISDGTNRTSTTATSYTLALSSNNVLSSSQGGLGLYLALQFADNTNSVLIGGIRLELEYRQ